MAHERHACCDGVSAGVQERVHIAMEFPKGKVTVLHGVALHLTETLYDKVEVYSRACQQVDRHRLSLHSRAATPARMTPPVICQGTPQCEAA